MSPFKPQKPSEAEAVRLGLLPRVTHSVSDSKYAQVINQKATPRGSMQKGPRAGRTQGTLTRLRGLELGWQGGLGRENLGHLLQAPHMDFTDPGPTSTPISCEVSEAPSSHRTTWSRLASLRSCPSKLLHVLLGVPVAFSASPSLRVCWGQPNGEALSPQSTIGKLMGLGRVLALGPQRSSHLQPDLSPLQGTVVNVSKRLTERTCCVGSGFGCVIWQWFQVSGGLL